MSDSSDFDDFEEFDTELEQLESEEAVEQRQENRLLSMKDRINAMKNGINPGTSAAQTQEIEQEPSTEGATTQTQADVREESKSDNKLHDEAIPIDTDSLETLQKKWELGSFGGSDSTNTPSPKTILGARKRAESTREKPTRNRRTRRSRATGSSGRRPGRAPARNKGKFMPPGRPHILELPHVSPGAGKGIHVESPETGEHVPVRGSVYEHVEQLGLHLHGLIVRAGTTATGADRSPETDATGRVFGLIPESIGFVRKMAENAYSLNDDSNMDSEGRPFQFAVVNILGREDHAQVMRSLRMARDNKTDALHGIIEKSGAPAGTKISTVLYNEMGEPFAFGVKFPDRQFTTISSQGHSHAQHLIFIHSTKAIGGGKSDEKLSEGDLPFECSTLSQEFEWWMSSLAVTGGKIGGLDTTIGGTSRTARYALWPHHCSRGCLPRERWSR